MSNAKQTVISLAALALLASSGASVTAAPELTARLNTQANASRVAGLAEARIAAAKQAIAEDEALVAFVAANLSTLPVGTPTGAKVIPVEVGDVIVYNRKGKDGAKPTEGKVIAIKPAADGKLSQYKVQVGEGFDAELVNVFPGTVTRNVTKNPDATTEDLPFEAPEGSDLAATLDQPAEQPASVVNGNDLSDEAVASLLD